MNVLEPLRVIICSSMKSKSSTNEKSSKSSEPLGRRKTACSSTNGHIYLYRDVKHDHPCHLCHPCLGTPLGSSSVQVCHPPSIIHFVKNSFVFSVFLSQTGSFSSKRELELEGKFALCSLSDQIFFCHHRNDMT